MLVSKSRKVIKQKAVGNMITFFYYNNFGIIFQFKDKK